MKTLDVAAKAQPKATAAPANGVNKYPPVYIRVEWYGDNSINVFHAVTMEPCPHIAELFEAVLISDVHPFNIKNQAAYDRYHGSPRLHTVNTNGYYLYIPDTEENRRICKTVASSTRVRMDVLQD